MTLDELKAIIRQANTISFAKQMKRASDNEIVKEMLKGINEHLKLAHQDGQRAMRERAAKECDKYGGFGTDDMCAAAIRNLEIT